MIENANIFIALVIGFSAVAFFIIHRWRSSPSRTVNRWLKQIEAGETPDFPRKTEFDFDLVLTDSGFEIKSLKQPHGEVVSVAWAHVSEVNAYKRDLMAVDQVCVAFTFDESKIVEINEEMRNFVDLCEQLPTHLPGTTPFANWYMEITVPAFELCLTRLFSRNSCITPQGMH